ncbi:MAG: glycosyltransferase [Lachnospiraceae bacterium]|nr:glycosyltransferase [Lachnospiraceae bacterium]
MDLVSIIVPVYNVENYLERCITSLLQQTYSKIEIILVDDGSTDSSGQICDTYNGDDRIVVLHKENGGLSDARNAGFAVAKGKYICFVDSDDWVDQNYIKMLYQCIEKNSCEVAGCRYKICHELADGVSNKNNYKQTTYTHITALKALINNEVKQVVWNKMYSKELIEGIDFPKEKYNEDEFWTYKVITKANAYVELNYVGYYYFQRTTSIMGERYSLKRLDAIEAKMHRLTYIIEMYPELELLAKEDLLFSCIYQGQLANRYLDNKEQCHTAYSILKKNLKNIHFTVNDISSMKFTHKIWYLCTKISFEGACIIRNIIKIGM